MEDGVYIVNQQFDIQYVNPALVKDFGAYEERKCYEYFHERMDACPWCKISDVLAGKTIRWEWFSSKNGNTYDLIDTPLKNPDGSISKLEIFRDITERKRAEAQRQELEMQLCQKYKMEAVGLMAGGIAHDFNNNLAIILGNIELSLRKISAQSEIAPHLRNAKVAIFRARDLVQQILTYSRRGVRDLKPVKLPLVIDETLNLLRATIPTTVEIETDLAHSRVMINADSTQIQEVLINLCNNAVHAMDGQGELKIKLESLNVESTDIPIQYDVAPGQFAKLSVQDSGSGMTPAVLEKIFDPFFTTKEVGEGTGMGLAVVHGIIESHGGFVRVNSHPGQGSTFEIYFPVIETPKLEIIPTIHDLPKGHERILFIDDEEMLTDVWSRMLSEHGYQVTIETSSTKALEMFQENPEQFDLVISDQTMPELSGKDLIKELLSIRPDLPTILCTGYSNKINGEEAEKLGIKAFCMKPLDLAELVQITRKVLDGAKQ